MSPADKRLTLALLLSLLIHMLLLSLTFGGQGLGLPGFGFPWQDRRIEAPDLRVVVVPPQVIAAEPVVTPVAEPLPQAQVEQPIAKERALTQSVPRAPTSQRAAAAINPESEPKAEVKSGIEAAPDVGPAQTPFNADQPGDTATPPIPAPPVIAAERSDETTSVVPATPAMPTPPVIAAAPSVPIPETATPSLRDAGDDARARIDKDSSEREVEPAKPEPSQQEAQRQAEQLEAGRQDAARQEAARVENARLEAERQEAARQAADRQEAVRQAAERQEAERQEAERQEAERKEAERMEAQRTESQRREAERREAEGREAERKEAERKGAERKEVERKQAAQAEVAQDAAARREAALRAIGRQLDEEAARREAATAAARESPSLPYSLSSARRYRLFGRADSNAEIILYAEAWARKIELNMTIDMVREAAKQPHADPLVTVAIRSDGSVESVTFVKSSGVPALDEAIRRVVDSQKPYQAFPPALARDYDVIEIRRTWYFDVAIRLY